MKKEIMELLSLGNEDKTLRLNGAFKLVARYTDSYDVNVALSKNPAVSVSVELEYTLAHDKFLGRSVKIESRSFPAIVDEIADKMQQMYSEFGAELAAAIKAGYLP